MPTAGQLIEPGPGDLEVIGLHSGDQGRGSGAGQEILQLRTAVGQRRCGEIPVAQAEQVEQDQAAGLGPR